MENLKNNFKEPVFTPEEDRFWEKFFLEELSKTEILWEANFYLKDLLDLTLRAKKPNAFSKIDGCINIVKNSNKSLEIRKTIMVKTLENFFPLLNSEEFVKEKISKEQITQTANLLGDIINQEQDDSLKNLCKEAFMETIVLKERENFSF